MDDARHDTEQDDTEQDLVSDVQQDAEHALPQDAWGHPIEDERAAELSALLAAWEAPEAARGDRAGPFHAVRLTGADVSALTNQLDSDVLGTMLDLHLEGANLAFAHLEEAFLVDAHLEGANLFNAHIGGANLLNAHLQDADLREADGVGVLLIGAHLAGANLELANLMGANLTGARLDGANLTGANLAGAELGRAQLEGATLDTANLAGADLRNAYFDKRSQLIDTVLTGALLDQATFDNTNLSVVEWRDVPLLGDEIRAREESGKDDLPKDRDTRRREHRAAVRANRRLAVALLANGLTEDASRFNYRAQLLQRSVMFYEGRVPNWIGSWLLAALAGYGYKPGRTILWYGAVVLGFAVAFSAVSARAGVHLSWDEAFVGSLTAFHGRGFFANTFQAGDPLATIAAVEAVIGLLIEVSFIATFTQRFFNSR